MPAAADKRIAVLGAGANGASVGADLTAAGLDVTLVELAHRIERGELEPGLENYALLAELAGRA